jgi:hypothetical protein
VAFPGPSLPVWGLGLVAFAIAVAVLGELVRTVGAQRVRLLRVADPIERGLLDLYLGGAVFYVLAAVPAPIFYSWTVALALLLGAVGLALFHLLQADRPRTRASIERLVAQLARPAYLLTLLAALGLLAVELSAVSGVGSGNTFDSSLLSTYTGLLLSHHTLPVSLAPVANQTLAYPQATTVWLGVAQSLFGLPPLRTSLLLTPLFLALGPLGAFVLGRRLGGSATVGVSFALVFALLSAGTREMVGGSNDFVFALPLVLLLVGWSTEWLRPGGPTLSAAIAFGGLAGYAAALNPVGPVWLLLTLPLMGLLARPWFGGAPARWLGRWAVALAAALVAVIPSLYALAVAPSSGGLAGSGTGTVVATGETVPQFVGYVDPFLFRAQDDSLSPFPLLRAELALLLVAGLLLLTLGRRRFGMSSDLARFLLAGGVVAVGLLGIGVLAQAGVGPFPELFRITNANELSVLLFILYAIVAGVPLAVAIGELSLDIPPIPLATVQRRRGREPGRTFGTALVVLLILVPGVAITTTELSGQLHQGYSTFSNLTQADVDLLEWAPSHLAPGSRVLVAPGSAAEFLAAYDPQLALLYPMTVGFLTSNPEYWTFVDGLQNGTYDASALTDLYLATGGSAHPFLVAVTENNTALFRPMLPGPLLAAQLPVEFHEGAVYLFVEAVSPPAIVPGPPGP